MEEQLLYYIVAIAPSLAAVISVVIMGIKVARQFIKLRGEVKDKTEVEDLKVALTHALYEVEELKKLLKKELETKTRVREK